MLTLINQSIMYNIIIRNTGFFIAITAILFLLNTRLYSEGEELGVFEKLDDYISDDYIFTDDKLQQINLLDAIDKPTVIGLVYYECPGICTPLLNGIAEVMERSDMALGDYYQVFIISFSHREAPVLAQKKKLNYIDMVGEGDTDDGFRFFTGDSITIARFLDNVGYKVKFDGKEYIHPATLIVASPRGKIVRYLHGTYFLPFNLKMAVLEAKEERSGPTMSKLMKYCFSYDPEGQGYVFNVTKISGTLILFTALVLLTYLILTNKKRKTLKFS